MENGIFEHIAFQSNLTLEEFTKSLSALIDTDAFQFDFENENNWSWAHDEDQIEVNISKPFKEGTLQEWDDTVPEGCNFGVSLRTSNKKELRQSDTFNELFVLGNLIPKYIKMIEMIIGGKAYYHRGKYKK
ncbi:hypothetical protein [Paenibacillus sp. DCT19]|uniref:hypothetical protein n=1 Tax=Paenibacillus sp. DCT19 TaxID=2211212 RepID=UPI000FE22A28|nr:hypothetical protein [Paenibacillus sp. DCT19]